MATSVNQEHHYCTYQTCPDFVEHKVLNGQKETEPSGKFAEGLAACKQAVVHAASKAKSLVTRNVTKDQFFE